MNNTLIFSSFVISFKNIFCWLVINILQKIEENVELVLPGVAVNKTFLEILSTFYNTKRRKTEPLSLMEICCKSFYYIYLQIRKITLLLYVGKIGFLNRF